MFGVIIIGISGLIYVNLTSLKSVETNYKEMMNVHYENIILSEKFNTELFNNQSMVERYLNDRKSNQLTDQEDSFKKLKETMLKLENNIPVKLADNFNTLIQNVDNYNSKFEELSQHIKDQGDSKKGIRGELRSTAHNLEKYIRESGLSDFYMVQVLTFRRREKDLLLRGDKKYLGKLNKDIQVLNQRMKSRGLDALRKAKISELVAAYKTQFTKLVDNIQIIHKEEKDLFELTTATNLVVEKLIKGSYEELNTYKELVHKEVKNDFFKVIGFSSLIFGMIIFINWVMYRVTKVISEDVAKLKGISEKFVISCDKISANSNNLSSIAQDQSSSIQETASSVNEISAMVSRNSDSAFASKKKSEENSTEANKSKETIREVLTAMDNLSESSNHMATRFNQTSGELQEVVTIINQIGEKAKVINDIVFQTKLLSFNASVEAARAGEHGKGFSVVAEEIGNLASMSGTSAEEITHILEESIKKVTGIVTNNQSDINQLVSNNTANLSKGKETVKRCETSLNSIITNITSINSSINEIASASQEQDSGVKEISEAITSLSHSNNKTTSVINDSVKFTSEIEENAHEIFEMATHLEKILLGNKKVKKKQISNVEFFDMPASNNKKDAA